jgi:predicted MFS family arabinose efflux permease
VLAGALQGLFLAAAFTTATAVVSKDRVGRALAIVIAGFSISTVLGLPLGVLVGSVLGWRGALGMVAGFALLAAGMAIAVVPSVPGSRVSAASGLRHALAPRVLAMLALSLTLFAAPGAVMSYLVPLLEHVTGVSGPLASMILVAYGIANVAGSFLGGRLADNDAARALVVVTLGLATSAAVLLLMRTQPQVAVAAILAWALFASSAPASVQHRTMSLAGPAGGLVASLPASAASAGIALGSTASGIAYSAAGAPAVVVTGMIIALSAFAMAVATRRLRPSLAAGRAVGVDRPGVRVQGRRGRVVPAEGRGVAGGIRTHPDPVLLAIEHGGQCVGPSPRVVPSHQQPGLLVDHGVPQPSDVGRDHRPATGLRLQRDQAEGLGIGGNADHIGDAVPAEELGAHRVRPEVHQFADLELCRQPR